MGYLFCWLVSIVSILNYCDFSVFGFYRAVVKNQEHNICVKEGFVHIAGSSEEIRGFVDAVAKKDVV